MILSETIVQLLLKEKKIESNLNLIMEKRLFQILYFLF